VRESEHSKGATDVPFPPSSINSALLPPRLSDSGAIVGDLFSVKKAVDCGDYDPAYQNLKWHVQDLGPLLQERFVFWRKR
jgi:hypothetical protein